MRQQDYLAILEYNEESAQRGDGGHFHYNYMNNRPETFGWRSIVIYNRKSDEMNKQISAFCDVCDKVQLKSKLRRDKKAKALTTERVRELAHTFFTSQGSSIENLYRLVPVDYPAPANETQE